MQVLVVAFARASGPPITTLPFPGCTFCSLPALVDFPPRIITRFYPRFQLSSGNTTGLLEAVCDSCINSITPRLGHSSLCGKTGRRLYSSLHTSPTPRADCLPFFTASVWAPEGGPTAWDWEAGNTARLGPSHGSNTRVTRGQAGD